MRALLAVIVGAVIGGGVYVKIDRSARLGVAEPGLEGASASLPTDPPVADITVAIDPAPTDPLLAQAERDPDAALVELSSIEPPGRRRAVALAVIAALGNTDRSIDRVATMLQASDRIPFRIDALVARAEIDPESALQSAQMLPTSIARQLAIPKLADVISSLDPVTALELSELIGDTELRAHFKSSVVVAWANSDSASALAWIEAAGADNFTAQAAAAALDVIAANDPRNLLATMDRFSPNLRSVAQQSAILALVEQEGPAVLSVLESVPGRNRSDLERAVAELLAFEDPEAALEWAKTLEDPRAAVGGVFRGAAALDYDGAINLFRQEIENAAAPGGNTSVAQITSAINSLMDSGNSGFDRVAAALIASNAPELLSMKRAMMVRWPQHDAAAALDWALDNLARVDSSAFPSIANNAGRTSPDLAITALERVPPDFQDEWIASIAGGVAEVDVDRALAFLDRHREEPGFFTGLGWVLESLGSTEPNDGASLLARYGDWTPGGHGSRFAANWARQDPVAAAHWAAGLPEAQLQADAVMNVAQSWSNVDADATFEWLSKLPDGVARDSGLEMYLSSTARTGVFDTRAVGAISDERKREQATANALATLSRSDPEAARKLIDELIQNPRLREEALWKLASQGVGPSVLTSGIDLPR